jgi:FtsZ-interacting cell division protein ZipA
MGYYDNILNLISLVLVLAIFFMVLFGCQFRKYRKIEKFSNNKESKKVNKEEDDEEEKEETNEEKEETNEESNEQTQKKQIEKKTDKNNNSDKPVLEGFEGQILDGLKNGSLTTNDMEQLIDKGTFTKENLENIIAYVETFKNQFN